MLKLNGQTKFVFSLISYDQESAVLLKNMAIIKVQITISIWPWGSSNCGLEAVEAVFGVDEHNKIVRNCVQRIAENMRNAAIS